MPKPQTNSTDIAGSSPVPWFSSSETERLRAIFPKILEELESGGCSADCSIEFMEMIPNEVGLVVRKLKRERLALAMLAADTPQFFNQMLAIHAKNLRDRLLSESVTAQTPPDSGTKNHG